jgi:hypothetical protein
VEALPELATQLEQSPCLLLMLDALGHGVELERPREVDDRARDRALVRAAAQPVHERLGDLEHVDRQLLEVTQRRVTGAEVVDRQRLRRAPAPRP